MDWYYDDGKKTVGPLTDEEFSELIASGKITKSTLVAKSDAQGWFYFSIARHWPEIVCLYQSGKIGTDIAEGKADGLQDLICSICGNVFPISEIMRYETSFICPNCKPNFIQRLKEGAPYHPSPITQENFAQTIINYDYDLDFSKCIRSSIQLLKKNFWLIIGSTFMAYFLFAICRTIPYLKYIIPIITNAPLIGGLLLFFINLARNKMVASGDIFDGFKGRNFLRLNLFYLFFFLFWLIFTLVIFSTLYGLSAFHSGNMLRAPSQVSFISFWIMIVLMFSVNAYLITSFLFTLPLIIDKNLSTWTAVKISFKMTHKHWFKLFGMFCLSGLIGIIGIFFFVIGLFVTLPIFFGALAYAYIEIFKG
jgi:predicted RNA-binding Zn-ribbon protein involved in translation (DUF1610 family)